MTTPFCFHFAAAVCLGSLTLQTLRAAETTLDFESMEAINAAFPESLRNQGGKGGSEVSVEGASGRLSLKTEVGKVARGTVYSAETYAPSLDFITAPLTITFNGALLEYPTRGSGYVGRFGVAGSPAGALSSGDRDTPNTGSAVYFEINRRNNSFRLVQVVRGVSSTLAEWSHKDLAILSAGSDSINNIAVQSLALTLSAKAWSVNVIFVSKKNPGTHFGKEASGAFSPAWTVQSWGSATHVAAEAEQQLAQDAAENEASANLLLGPITIAPAPAFSRTILPEAAEPALLAGSPHPEGIP